MPTIVFEHEHVAPSGREKGDPLAISTGVDEISWGYKLNVAKFSTYGGEVVQILSCFIDDLQIQGMVRSYAVAETIYKYFMDYFVIATQGPIANAGSDQKFEQTPMIFTYPHRNWRFYIQPLQAANFIYDLETVVPKWTIKAHVVDRGINAESLRELVGRGAQHQLEQFGSIKLTGNISPDSGDPELNPFIAPVTPTTKNAKGEFNPDEIKFVPQTQKEVTEGVGQIADYYSHLVKNFYKGDFQELLSIGGSRPIFGRPNAQTGGTEQPEEIESGGIKVKGTKPLKSNQESP